MGGVAFFSGIGLSLRFVKIRHGAATKGAAIYLTPPVAAIRWRLLFGEGFEGLALCGLAVVVPGGALVVLRDPRGVCVFNGPVENTP